MAGVHPFHSAPVVMLYSAQMLPIHVVFHLLLLIYKKKALPQALFLKCCINLVIGSAPQTIMIFTYCIISSYRFNPLGYKPSWVVTHNPDLTLDFRKR